MNKYKIEGNINFYEELYKSLDDDENEHKTEEDNNACLITNQPLTTYYVKLICGHKFNYIPLFNDILNHKNKFNLMESNGKLGLHDIRCPYCRKKQHSLLNYIEELKLPKIHGVNYIDESKIITNEVKPYKFKTCEYKQLNPNYDNEQEESSSNVKFLTCSSAGTKINYYNENAENYGDDKDYCWFHKKQMIKMYKTQIANKKKEEIKQAKIQLKNNLKIEKEIAKQKAKDEKMKGKIEKKSNKDKKECLNSELINIINDLDVSNNVLGPLNIVEEPHNNINTGCIEILKTGLKKGTHCGCKIVEQNMCKRHYKKIQN